MAVFLYLPSRGGVASFVADSPFCQKERTDAVVGEIHRQDRPVVDGAECPGAPDYRKVDQGFRADIRPAVEPGGSGVRSVTAYIGFGGVHGGLIPQSRDKDAMVGF